MKLLPSSALSFLRLARSIAPLVPGRGHTVPQVVFKCIAIADKTLSHYGLLNQESRIRRIVNARGLVPATMPMLPWLLLRTRLAASPGITIEASSTQSIASDDPMEVGTEDTVRVASVDGVGEVVFGGGYYLHMVDQVFVSKGWDDEGVRRRVWDLYPNGIHLALTDSSRGPSRDPWSFTELPAYKAPVSAKAQAMLETYTKRLLAFAAEGTARCYLFFGPRGTGKTGFGWRMGKAIGGRTLAMEAKALGDLSVQELEMVVQALRPALLIIDDVDGTDMMDCTTRVRYVLDAIRKRFPTMTVVITANRTEGIDHALLRGERIDIPVHFPAPDADERRDILALHLPLHHISLPSTITLDDLVARTDGYSHADIASICLRARHEPMDEVLASVALLNELAGKSLGAVDGPADRPRRDALPNLPKAYAPSWEVGGVGGGEEG